MPILAISCQMTPPSPLPGMEIIWPMKKREIGDSVTYRCTKGGYIEGLPDPLGWDTTVLTGKFINHVYI